VGIRATPLAEALVALVLMYHVLRPRAQGGEVGSPTPRIPASASGRKAAKKPRVHTDAREDDV
jgi:chorismate synthase